RYSYVINNPLAFTDPSGYSWLSEAFHAVQDLFRAVPIIGAIVRIAAVALCGPGASICAFAMAVISSSAVAGITTGKVSAGLQAGAVAGLTAAAFYAVGTLTTPPGGIQPFTGAHIANIAGHALVGCASAVAMGGKCGPGALSAAVPSFAGPFIKDIGLEGKLVANTVIGGAASVAAGGKFENGAITAAFGYLFNETMHVGGTISVPSQITDDITKLVRWITGNDSFVMGNGASGGLIIQYPGATDARAGTADRVGFDVGAYGQVATTVGDVSSVDFAASPEVGMGLGTIHGTFDGKSISFNLDTPWGGGSATFSQGDQGMLTFSGVAARPAPGFGLSATQNFTGAFTAGDIRNYIFGR